jgi:hypothetical protein
LKELPLFGNQPVMGRVNFKRIVDEITQNHMRRYIHTQFASQALTIEIYYCIQSKVQKEEEKARLQAGLKPEIGLPDYMYYMNAVGRFLHPELGIQNTGNQKGDPLEKGWKKCLFKISLGNVCFKVKGKALVSQTL